MDNVNEMAEKYALNKWVTHKEHLVTRSEKIRISKDDFTSGHAAGWEKGKNNVERLTTILKRCGGVALEMKNAEKECRNPMCNEDDILKLVAEALKESQNAKPN